MNVHTNPLMVLSKAKSIKYRGLNEGFVLYYVTIKIRKRLTATGKPICNQAMVGVLKKAHKIKRIPVKGQIQVKYLLYFSGGGKMVTYLVQFKGNSTKSSTSSK